MSEELWKIDVTDGPANTRHKLEQLHAAESLSRQ